MASCRLESVHPIPCSFKAQVHLVSSYLIFSSSSTISPVAAALKCYLLIIFGVATAADGPIGKAQVLEAKRVCVVAGCRIHRSSLVNFAERRGRLVQMVETQQHSPTENGRTWLSKVKVIRAMIKPRPDTGNFATIGEAKESWAALYSSLFLAPCLATHWHSEALV